ncbi:MAG: S1 RNA-binding domain-containing protein [Clostridia bacterium]
MELAIGTVFEGKVTGITKFGAFVALPENRTGMVHISEVAHAYVSDIRQHLEEGQTVSVKVIGIDPAGRINLSIKQTTEPEPGAARQAQGNRPLGRRPAPPKEVVPATFEDKLKQFMQDSETRISDIKSHTDKRRGAAPRRGRAK